MKLIKDVLIISFIQLLFVSVLSASSISGKVTIDSPTGVVAAEGAEVFAFSSTGNDSLGFTTTTNQEGIYTLNNLPAGNYALVAQGRNLYGEFNNIVVLGENEDIVDIDIALFDGDFSHYDNLISGVVKNAVTSNTISDVTIELVKGSSDSLGSVYGISLEDGTFEIVDIEPGTYTLYAYTYGLFSKYTHSSVIEITEDSKITGLEIKLTPFATDGSLAGKVLNSTTSTPIENVEISLFGITNWSPTDSLGTSVKTDENGKYRIDNLLPGAYWYYTTVEGYESMWGEIEVNGATTLDLLLKQLVSGIVEGVVLDEDGNPVPDTFIDFIPASPNNFNYNYATTNAEGKYSVEVGVGDYYVSCYIGNDSLQNNQQTPYLPVQIFYKNALTIEDATTIEVKENKTLTDISFTLPSMKEIKVVVTGSVKDDNGNAIEGASVEAWIVDDYYHICKDSTDMDNVVKTDSDGNYSLTISQKSYGAISIALLSYKEGFAVEYYNEKSDWYLAEAIKVSESGTQANINFTLSEKSQIYNNSISGTVTDEDGSGLSDVFVTAFSADGFGWEETTTDDEGNYTISNLEENDYIVSFFSMNSYIPELYNDVLTWEEATSVNANGDIAGIDAVLAKGDVGNWDSSRVVIGNISDVVGNPLPNVTVILNNKDGKAIAAARTDAKGNYRSATKSKLIGEAVVSRVGYESTVKSFDKYSPVANTVILNVSLKKTVTDVKNPSLATIPSEFTMQQNYPNPFNPTTVINFSLPTAQNVKLEVFNLLGENVATLLNKPMGAGNHKYEFDASNFNSGLYLYRISAGSFVDVKKMMLLK